MPFNREKVVQYARKWALSTNSDFPRCGNDCTNFVSQCLYAGGWTMVGAYEHEKDDNVWWYKDARTYPFTDTCVSVWLPFGGHHALRHCSYTWAGAQNLYNFLQASKRGTELMDESYLDRGDVIQIARNSDNHVHHSMVVVQKVKGDLLLAYHTDDQLDKPLSSINLTDDFFVYWKLSDAI